MFGYSRVVDIVRDEPTRLGVSVELLSDKVVFSEQQNKSIQYTVIRHSKSGLFYKFCQHCKPLPTRVF